MATCAYKIRHDKIPSRKAVSGQWGHRAKSTPAESTFNRIYVTGMHTAYLLTIDDILVVQKLWAEGGVTRFFKGWTPCLLRAFPANGIMLLTVDKVSYMLA